MPSALTNTVLPDEIAKKYNKIYFLGKQEVANKHGYKYVDNAFIAEHTLQNLDSLIDDIYISLQEDDAITLLLFSGYGCYKTTALVTERGNTLPIYFSGIEFSCLAHNLLFALYCLRNLNPSEYENVKLYHSVAKALKAIQAAVEKTTVEKLKDIYER